MWPFPVFKIGLFNLWWCTGIIFLLPEIVNILSGKNWRRACKLPGMSPTEKAIYFTWIGINCLIYVYSVFAPFVYGSIWFYAGVLIFMGSLVILAMGTYAYQTTSDDKLITKGIYQLTRNPGYFGSFCAYIGMGLMSASWLLLLLALLHFALYQITVRYEERMCKELFPEEFLRYKQSVKKNFVWF